MRNRWFRHCSRLLLVASAGTGAGCGLLLGLDEFKDAPSPESGGTGTGTGTGGEGGGAACEPGEVVSCYEGPDDTENIGVCKAGQKKCNDEGSAYGSCNNQKTPDAETCTNPADENCDTYDCAIWSKILGDASNQTIDDVVLDSDDNIIITGRFTGTLTMPDSAPLTTEARALYLAKFAADGTPVWSRKFGGAYASTTSLTVDSEDNVILAGTFESRLQIEDVTLEVGDRGIYSAYVAKWNPSGTLSWAISEDLSLEALEIAGTATDTLGNVFVYGRETCRSACHIAGEGLWLCKYNISGQRTWCKHFVGSDSEWKRLAGGIAIDRMNNIYITGSLASSEEARPVEFGGPILELRDDLDGFIVKLDNDGKFKAQQTIRGPGEQISVGIAADKDDNVIVLANHDGMTAVGIYSASSAGMRDILVAKLNSQLSCLWNRSLGGSGDETAIDLAVAADGTIAVTGRAQGDVDYGGGPLIGAGGFDLPLIKLAPDGAHVWSKLFGDDRNQTSKAVAILPTGEPILGSDIEGSVNVGAGTLYSSGGSDILLAKFGR